jgi:type II secretory pathway component PulJ
MISMSIFAVMSVIIMSVYIQTTNTARKMNATRELSETAREITERIAQDVRSKGIDTGTELDTSPGAYILWTDQASYTSSGSEYMSIT